MLLESRIEDVFKKHDGISNGVKKQYLEKIPEGNSRQLDWVLTRHSKGELNGVDVTPHLLAFNRNLQNMPKKQIEQYKNFDEFKKATEPYINKNLSDKDVAKHYSHVIYHSPTMTITHHLNHISAVKAATLAKNNPNYDKVQQKGKASWCVSVDDKSGRDYFDDYTDGGLHKFYSIEINKNGQQRKYGLVANPEIPSDEVELRDEVDQHEHIPILDGFVNSHREILHTPLKSFFDGSDRKKYLSKVEAIKKGMIGKDEVDHIMKYPKSKLVEALIEHNNPHLTEEHLIKLASSDEYGNESIFKHSNVTPRVIDKGMDSHYYDTRNMAIRHSKANYDNFVKASKDYSDGIRNYAVEKYPSLRDRSDDVDTLIHQKHYYGLKQKLQNDGDFTDDQYRKIFDMGNDSLITDTFNKNLPFDLKEKVLNDDNSYHKSLLLQRSDLSDEQYKRIIPHLPHYDIGSIINRPHLSETVTDALLDANLENVYKQHIFSEHPISDRHFNNILKNRDITSISSYTDNHNMTSEHISKLLDEIKDDNHGNIINKYGINRILNHRNINKELLEKASKNKSLTVKNEVLGSRYLNQHPEIVKNLINDEHEYIKGKALSHELLDKDTMKKVYQNSDNNTKFMVLKNPNWTKDELNKMYNDTNDENLKYNILMNGKFHVEDLNNRYDDFKDDSIKKKIKYKTMLMRG